MRSMNSPLPVASAADEPTTTTDEASSARPSEQKSAGWTMAETASLMSNMSDGRTGYREPDIDGYRDAEARGMPDVRSPKTTRVTSSKPTTTIHTSTVSPPIDNGASAARCPTGSSSALATHTAYLRHTGRPALRPAQLTTPPR